MDLFSSFLIAIGLAMDAFAVSIGVGATGKAKDLRPAFRLALHFGIFQSGMTILGWLAGSTIEVLIKNFDHWIALALLTYVGGKMIHSGFNKHQPCFPDDPSKGKLLVVLAIATSLDALAVGLGMAFLNTQILFPSIVIGVVTFILSGIGLAAGNRLSERFGKSMEIIGGIILIAIGIRILITHIAG